MPPEVRQVDEAHRLPRLPQFSLRTLFVVVTICGGVFAIMSVIGALWSTALAWLLVLIAAHVAGNAWGTRARIRPRPVDEVVKGLSLADRARQLPNGPVTPLRGQYRIGRLMLAVSGLGVAIGTVAGGYLLFLANWDALRAAQWPPRLMVGIALGGASAGVIGGFLGFLASSFLQVTGSAWREATREAGRCAGGAPHPRRVQQQGAEAPYYEQKCDEAESATLEHRPQSHSS
jgi:hypothetical protein